MRRFTVATLVMAVALLTACDGDSTGNGGSIFGTYTLQTWNDMNLPVQALGGGVTGPVAPGDPVTMFELTAGSVGLNSDDTCSASMTFRTTIDGTVTATESIATISISTADTTDGTCTYSVTGTTIRVEMPGSDPPVINALILTGSITGNTLTLVNEDGDTFVFTK